MIPERLKDSDLQINRFTNPAAGELSKFVDDRDARPFHLFHRTAVGATGVFMQRYRAANQRVSTGQDRRNDAFFGGHVVRLRSDPGIILGCYSIGLDNQEHAASIPVHAYCADLLLTPRAGGESRLAELVLNHIDTTALGWSHRANDPQTLGIYVSKGALVPVLTGLGFRTIGTDIPTRCYGHCSLLVKTCSRD